VRYIRFQAPVNPEDGDSTVLRNVGVLPHHYTASHFKRQWLGSKLDANCWMKFPFFVFVLI